ncbi:Spore coat protein GerQ [Lentibacillus sp. JNUCC-1]|uniref:spore coat protein GerQ n=1 Tax=Lentibacillus sp. JNUCC-1 TaxID=2654513 RepID=UPI0012E979E3|nr:spore coat protein GerQ [Lentibacillus sp. JNUCC-1]MUV37440.1 Spore coat protein GerQ [Lentibacillus sp. JNUCC-1]
MSEKDQNEYRQQYMNAPYMNMYQGYPNYYYPQSSPAYYPSYQYNQPQMPQQQQPSAPDVSGMLPMEQSYVENILRLNRGKVATLYMTFENNSQWNAKVFKGVIEAAGRDHIIISDPETGKRYLLLMIYLDYVTFDEEINYDYPYGAGSQMSMYQPR